MPPAPRRRRQRATAPPWPCAPAAPLRPAGPAPALHSPARQRGSHARARRIEHPVPPALGAPAPAHASPVPPALGTAAGGGRRRRVVAARTEKAERERQAERAERERQAKQLAEIMAYLHNIGHLTGVQAPQFTPPPQVFASPLTDSLQRLSIPCGAVHPLSSFSLQESAPSPSPPHSGRQHYSS
ncbi:hypothetical protein SORBI_3008G081150 [Sorghum bicolor]|uniref:Uncharacterized protein n=1 Tax=Sorghum bicolor TaxID=4558 RepID=A0A1Z5R5C5_SORBI|nr:hypothetical protein SORBI_3008G081150 [Sorghum bicolor]